MIGVNAFRTYVNGWYDYSFQDVIYADNRSPDITRMISAILAGYAWDTNNPYVEKSDRRLNALAQTVGAAQYR
ncbi:FAD-dependent oxidoreductase, partial [Kingella kingae]|nr:FAD-dependent oxidoreductase [Kingella kingae]